MHNLQQDLKRAADGYGTPHVMFDDVRRKATRRNGVRRVSAALVALAVVAASGAFLLRAFDRGSSIAGTRLLGVENGPISFTIAQNRLVAETSQIGIVDGPGAPVETVKGYPDFDTGGWSPDGSMLVFSRAADSSETDYGIWVVARNGAEPRQLTSGPHGDFAAMFSPNGQQILFLRRMDGISPALMLMDSDGGNQRLIAGADDEVIFGALWSPDGRHILTIGHPGEEGEVNWLAVMDPDGTDRRVLFRGRYNEPSWSADGTQILISSQSRVLVVPLNGGEPIEVLDGLARQGLSQVEWSPNGANVPTRSPSKGEADTRSCGSLR